MMDLLKRREEIIAQHAAQARYDPHWQAEAKAGRCITQRPIAFLCDDEVKVVGDCAGVVVAGLERFLEQTEADPEGTDARTREPIFAQAVAVGRRATGGEVPGDGTLTFTQQRWNACLCALTEAGVTVVLADGLRAPE